MAARNRPRVSDALAHLIVTHYTDCLQRACVEYWEFAASKHYSEGLELTYDTLVLHVRPLELADKPNQPTQPPAELICEALVLVGALSRCAGYAFHENFAFWNALLGQDEQATRAMPPLPTMVFPRVVLEWSPYTYQSDTMYYKAEVASFGATVVGLFATSSRRRLSNDGQKLLGSIHEDWVESHPISTVDCDVCVPFARAAKDTKTLFDILISSANAVMTASAQNEFVWRGVRLVGDAVARYTSRTFVSAATFRLLRRLCVSLPPSVVVDVVFPRTHSEVDTPDDAQTLTAPEALRIPFPQFITAAIGVTGTEMVGNMKVLDLRHHRDDLDIPPPFDMASLCTLLPLSRSLQTLWVAVRSETDLFWLAYAALHPLTPATQWRTLCLRSKCTRHAKWSRLSRNVPSDLLSSILWSQLARWPFPVTTTADDRASATSSFVRRTAKLARNAKLLSRDKTESLVPLVAGCDLELCDTTTSLHELGLESGDPILDHVEVVVAGIGLGWVHKRHLTQLVDTHFDGASQSCLSTLVLDSYVARASDMTTVLSIFGPSLVHLSAVLSEPFCVSTVARACQRLESLEMFASWTESDESETPVMPSLRSVGIVCDDESLLPLCVRWLQGLPRLESLRLQFGMRTYRPVEFSSEIDDELAALVAAKARTLRSLTVFDGNPPQPAQPPLLDDINRLACDASSKVALLSVLRYVRVHERSSRHTILAKLDSDMVRRVFDFAGPAVRPQVINGFLHHAADWYDHIRTSI